MFLKKKNQQRYDAKLTSKEYEKIRIAHSELLKGHKHSKETLLKIGEKSKGRIPWNKGKHDIYSEETLKAIKDARAKQIFSNESQEKKRNALLGRETPWLTGIKQSKDIIEKRKSTFNREDIKQKMKESAKRRWQKWRNENANR